MLEKIIERLPKEAEQGHLLQLEQAEQLFHYSSFTSRDALNLGNEIIRAAVKHGEEPAVRIIRLSDSLILFQYVGENRSERNLDFAQGKGNTAVRSGHSSLYALVHSAAEQSDPYQLEEQDDCIPAGGAFPIFDGEKLTAAVMISGLPNGLDHTVVVEARCHMLGCDVPKYDGPLI